MDTSYFITDIKKSTAYGHKLYPVLLHLAKISDSLENLLILSQIRTCSEKLSEQENHELHSLINQNLLEKKQLYISSLLNRAMLCEKDVDKKKLRIILRDAVNNGLLTFEEKNKIEAPFKSNNQPASALHAELLGLDLTFEQQLERAFAASFATHPEPLR